MQGIPQALGLPVRRKCGDGHDALLTGIEHGILG
jgi:hypothetical protein